MSSLLHARVPITLVLTFAAFVESAGAGPIRLEET